MIYLDTNVLIYANEDDTGFGERVLAAIAGAGSNRLAVSPLVRMECLVSPIRSGNFALQHQYEGWFAKFVQLDMSDAVFSQATFLRARFNLKTPDALHLACAQHHGCEALWTNDERLSKAAHGLAVNVLA
ncbi:MAG TPA: type II toxin-antitoxin system VapC family toxin [Luteimonas sp.]|nr:type II toxin-antitoxin system VapC family toxin [Luteimonas sp.]